MKIHSLLVTVTLSLIAGSASAHEFLCTSSDGTERSISVEHEVPGAELPCAVRYDKPSEGGTTYPWRADNTPGFCEEKADDLAMRLRSFGWSCERTDDEEGPSDAL